MRRYGQQSQPVTIPGQDAKLKLTLQPLLDAPEPAPLCVPSPTGLFWFSDLSGGFTEASEAAYLLDIGAAGPVLGVARVLGETCDAVEWSHDWTPDGEDLGSPGVMASGADLLVYPLHDTAPGALMVSAGCAGRSFGPIVLTLLARSCCPDPVAVPAQPAPFEVVLAAGKEIYFLSLGHTGVGAEIKADWSTSYTGADPGNIALTPNGLTCLLMLDRNFGDETTAVTVTAELFWLCGTQNHQKSLTWDFQHGAG